MKIDKTAFSTFKKENEPNDFKFWQSKTVSERLKPTAYFNSVAFNYDLQNPPPPEWIKLFFQLKNEINNGTKK